MTVELLLPAGNLQKIRCAFYYGADAVYCGLPAFSLRTLENQITNKEMEQGIKLARKLGKKIYITLNAFPHNEKLEFLDQYLETVNNLNPDGLVIADAGIFAKAQKHCPKIPLHISVQANIVNYLTARFWYEQGAKRIIVSRQLSIPEIAKIHQECPKLELEVFVHGSICMAYSGHCFLSNYMSNRDANQGVCAHSCRWKYKVKRAELIEEERPSESMPIEESEDGTHIFSSRDLCAIEYLKDLLKAGVTSLKIEGRNKTVYYLATVARAYREALDDALMNKPFNSDLILELEKTAHRGFFTGFLVGLPNASAIQDKANTSRGTHNFLGEVLKYNSKTSQALISVRNPIQIGDEVEFVLSKRKNDFLQKITTMTNIDFEPIEIAHGGHFDVWIPVDKKVMKGVVIRKKL